MPSIPPTRQKILKRPQQDTIQWKLTNRHEKLTHHHIESSPEEDPVTTMTVAKNFIKLLNNQDNKKEKINCIVKDIKQLYDSVSFSSRVFLEYIVNHATNMARLLQIYHSISVRLDVLALTLRSLLNFIPEFDEPLCELFEYQDDIGQAYIQALDEKTMHDFFIKDATQFVDWSGLVKRENAKRLLYILKYDANRMKKDQCLSQLLCLNTLPVEIETSLHYFKQLSQTKELIFTPSKVSTKHMDAMIAKSPVLLFISTWFSEFNPNALLKLTEFALKMYDLNALSDNKQDVPDLSLLVYVWNAGCKQLAVDGRDVIQIPDIIQALNHAATKSLEQDDAGGFAIILTFAQLTFQHLHASVGYTYVCWFETTFMNAETSLLNKRMSIVFINLLQQLIPFEVPSILQIHGKALHHCSTIADSKTYVSTVKKRLLELGVEATFRSYPQSIQKPIQSIIVVIEDEVAHVLQEFIQRDGVIPKSVREACLFKRLWFQHTFLPKLISWEGKEIKARNELIEALKKDRQVPDHIYYDFIQRTQKTKTKK